MGLYLDKQIVLNVDIEAKFVTLLSMFINSAEGEVRVRKQLSVFKVTSSMQWSLTEATNTLTKVSDS